MEETEYENPLDETQTGALNDDELYERHRIVVDAGQETMRIDKFLQQRLSGVSRTKIKLATMSSCVLVNGATCKASYNVKPADVISVLLPYPPHPDEIVAENIPLDIVYEDDDIIVVNKVAGMVVHPAVGNFTGTLVNALTYHLKDKVGADGKPLKPYLVHRIDKDTSGLLLVAKNESAQVMLAKQFFDHTTERKYAALVWGDFDEESGTVVGNIARSQKDRRIMAVYDDPEVGKHAVTHWTVKERFGYVTLIECVLETGRTHQIRAHMKHIGHPLFADCAYGGDKILKGTTFSKYRQFVDICFAMMPRQALHAFILGFEHPTTHQRMHFECPMPPDMQTVLDRWRLYTQSR
ncbi:MAG: RluA family pseudouridine synthase [Bacteroidales bacterium]|nr:RluA family pseudouridine synthase [Bacteroidales bacterium]